MMSADVEHVISTSSIIPITARYCTLYKAKCRSVSLVEREGAEPQDEFRSFQLTHGGGGAARNIVFTCPHARLDYVVYQDKI